MNGSADGLRNRGRGRRGRKAKMRTWRIEEMKEEGWKFSAAAAARVWEKPFPSVLLTAGMHINFINICSDAPSRLQFPSTPFGLWPVPEAAGPLANCRAKTHIDGAADRVHTFGSNIGVAHQMAVDMQIWGFLAATGKTRNHSRTAQAIDRCAN